MGPSIAETKWKAKAWADVKVTHKKTGHCLTGQFHEWTKRWPTTQCWWCRYKTQTREHFFKNCPHWKRQQKILWAEVRRDIRRGKDQFKIRDLFVDERCSQAVLDFLSTRVPGPAEEPPRVRRRSRSSGNEARRGEEAGG